MWGRNLRLNNRGHLLAGPASRSKVPVAGAYKIRGDSLVAGRLLLRLNSFPLTRILCGLIYATFA